MDIPITVDPHVVADLSSYTLRDLGITVDHGVFALRATAPASAGVTAPTTTIATARQSLSGRKPSSPHALESLPPVKRRRKQRFSRSRTGCLTCRQRKVRCDEVHPTCTRCADLDLKCAWNAPDVAGPHRVRQASAIVASESASSSESASPRTATRGSTDAVNTDNPISDFDFLSELLSGSTSAPAVEVATTYDAAPAVPLTHVAEGRGGSLIPWVQAVAAPTTLSLTTSALASRRAHANVPSIVALPTSHPQIGPLSTTMEPFMHAFPSPSARRLFHHYLTSTSTIVIAMGNKDDFSKNPFLAVSLPLISLNTESPARAALRLSLLSVAAAHLHHLHLGGPSGNVEDMLVETKKTKRQATAKMLLSLSKEGDVELDSVLAACVIIVTRDVLSADHLWRENLDFAIRLIQKRGGPQAMIAENPNNFTRRFILEQLATHDVFGSFTTGQEPALLGAWAPWWFDCERGSKTSCQWESWQVKLYWHLRVHTDRQCRIVCYKKTRFGLENEADPELDGVADVIDHEAASLIDELRIWAISQQDSPRKARVQFGDHIYRHAMIIYLLCEVLGHEASDERVQSAVHCVLELCSEVSLEPVMLVWPLMIAGAVASADDRKWVRDLFDAFAFQYCYDLPAARRVLEEQWRRIDTGLGRTSWDVLMKDMACPVLLI